MKLQGKSITLLPKQIEAIFSKRSNIGYGGAWGSGKTIALCVWIKQKADIADNLILVGRKTYDELRDTTQREFFDMFPSLKKYHNKNENATYLSNSATILWRHLDEWHKLTNLNLGAFAIDQAEEISEACYIALHGRLRRKVEGRQSFIVFNTEGHNWIWRLFKRQESKNYHLIETTSFDNPHLPIDYFERLKHLPDNVVKRYVFGSWSVFEGMVYDQFVEDRHIIEPFEIPDNWKKDFCLDHGFRNPTAVLWYAIDYDGTIYIYDEHYEREKPISYHAGEIKKRGLFDGIADPSVFKRTLSKGDYIYSVADEYRDNGINLRSAFKSKEDASINRVNEWFKADKIKIFKNCQNTEREILNWKWKDVKPSWNKNLPEEPEDKDNHTCDDIKYIVASRSNPSDKPEIPILKGTVAWFIREEERKRNDWKSKYR